MPHRTSSNFLESYLKETDAAQVIAGVQTQEPIDGFTHQFYRYPARFSPLFARAIIQTFTKLGDTVFDPFMGGGTTLVEARTLGRRAVGTDINELAVFISQVKTMVLTSKEGERVKSWVSGLIPNLLLKSFAKNHNPGQINVYQKNIGDRTTWPIRRLLEMALAKLDVLGNEQQRRFARCLLLKTAQWALDCRENVPTAQMFREQLLKNLEEMLEGSYAFSERAQAVVRNRRPSPSDVLCLHRSAVGVEADDRFHDVPTPSLVLTSPPYPGVHVLYHRWQVKGRKETPAPYWIINGSDGCGESFYTFGNRKQPGLSNFFKQAQAAFSSVANISNKKTIVVQMVAFSEPKWQLPEYLKSMENAGLREVFFPVLSNSGDKRLWRHVPNRKWYATQKLSIATDKEVVLFHRKA